MFTYKFCTLSFWWIKPVATIRSFISRSLIKCFVNNFKVCWSQCLQCSDSYISNFLFTTGIFRLLSPIFTFDIGVVQELKLGDSILFLETGENSNLLVFLVSLFCFSIILDISMQLILKLPLFNFVFAYLTIISLFLLFNDAIFLIEIGGGDKDTIWLFEIVPKAEKLLKLFLLIDKIHSFEVETFD